MKKIDIRDKLEKINTPVSSIPLGDFDRIGEFTAKRNREPNGENYHRYGAFYRANYERGILIYNLIRKFNLTSMLEVGFGRGYATFCAAKAFHDSGVNGQVTTIDPEFDEKFLNALGGVLNPEWFKYVKFVKGRSQDVLPKVKDERFDLVYIDGDHSYEGTKNDWEHTKDIYDKFLLFDDYHLPSKNDPGIECSKLIDEIDDDSKELIIMDRRIFLDDRRMTDEEIDYGQVLLTKPGVSLDDW